MAKLFKFEVVTPIRTLYSDEVESIVFETPTGQMGVMASHVPMLIANIACTLKITKNKEDKYAFISDGYIEVSSEKVTAVVDEAEWIDEIDIEAAKQHKASAEEDLAKKEEDFEKKAELVASIQRSSARIKTAGLHINNK
jgi:F-type H+-transporting ATPase subunit epsilon